VQTSNANPGQAASLTRGPQNGKSLSRVDFVHVLHNLFLYKARNFMEKIAIIGSGIAGMTCAWNLRELYQVDLFEQDARPGGHTHTVEVQDASGIHAVDTGFMVFNEATYPNLMRLFESLKVESNETDMSFGVNLVQQGIEYGTTGFDAYFAQKTRVLDPDHWKLAWGIHRLFKSANLALETEALHGVSIREFLYRDPLLKLAGERFLLPMASAIWSTHHTGIGNYPASSILSFLKNHGLLDIGKQLRWRTIRGGSRNYRDRLLSQLPAGSLQLNRRVEQVRRKGQEAEITTQHGETLRYHAVILATHADQAIRILSDPNPMENQLLRAFTYTRNPAVLHSDLSVMPRSRSAWSSWNYRIEGKDPEHPHASTHYWMNRLQNLASERPLLVSIDYDGCIDPDRIHWSGSYEHPAFDAGAIHAQSTLPELNRSGPIYFCGSYFGHGFHEDAHVSALRVVKNLKNRKGLDHDILPL
jgi:predicted NAD/FAD-binding protein